MYAETGLMFPYLQSFSHGVHQFDEFCCSQKPNASLGMTSSLIPSSTISDYNLGGEGDLFKAPEPVIGDPPSIGVDPMTALFTDIESSIENGQLLSEVFYECRKDLLAKEGSETMFSEVISVQIPTDEKINESPFQESVSPSCLRSTDTLCTPSFPDFPVLDFGTANGMRRAFSEGDIKALGYGDINLIQSPVGQPKIMSSLMSEDRREKLSRYRSKKSKRNFGRKIKYACRKTLADNQPRIRGRFAKTEE